MSDEERQVTGGTEIPPTQRQRDEKEEKERREEQEKRDEKEEKERGRQRDPLSSLLWAFFLIVAGLILLAHSQGLITWDQFGSLWNLFFIVAGLFLLAEVVLRLLLPAYRRPVLGQLIGGIVLLAMGASGIVGSQLTWPIALIALGLIILLGGLFRGRL